MHHALDGYMHQSCVLPSRCMNSILGMALAMSKKPFSYLTRGLCNDHTRASVVVRLWCSSGQDGFSYPAGENCTQVLTKLRSVTQPNFVTHIQTLRPNNDTNTRGAMQRLGIKYGPRRSRATSSGCNLARSRMQPLRFQGQPARPGVASSLALQNGEKFTASASHNR